MTPSSRKCAKDDAQIATSYTVTTIPTVLILRYPRARPFVEILARQAGWPFMTW